MNEAELSELLTAPGFFRFLAQQAKLAAEEAKRIYLLGRPWGLWPPDLDLNREAAETGVDVYTYLAALQPLLDMDTTQKEAQLAVYEATLSGGETTRSEEHTSELQSRLHLVCRLLLEKKKKKQRQEKIVQTKA